MTRAGRCITRAKPTVVCAFASSQDDVRHLVRCQPSVKVLETPWGRRFIHDNRLRTLPVVEISANRVVRKLVQRHNVDVLHLGVSTRLVFGSGDVKNNVEDLLVVVVRRDSAQRGRLACASNGSNFVEDTGPDQGFEHRVVLSLAVRVRCRARRRCAGTRRWRAGSRQRAGDVDHVKPVASVEEGRARHCASAQHDRRRAARVKFWLFRPA
mmetsp:Transcript_36310/g.112355  ORF Transcript_36310/g.112355 Transcript_36310/m.112355 type:complete len:211 (-) Transcript_36310:270-902(-)